MVIGRLDEDPGRAAHGLLGRGRVGHDRVGAELDEGGPDAGREVRVVEVRLLVVDDAPAAARCDGEHVDLAVLVVDEDHRPGVVIGDRTECPSLPAALAIEDE